MSDLTNSGSTLAKKKQLKVEDVFQVGALEMDRLGWLVNLVTYPSVWPAVTSMTHCPRGTKTEFSSIFRSRSYGYRTGQRNHMQITRYRSAIMEKGFEFLTTRRVWWECDVHTQDTNSSAIGPEEYSVRGGSLVLYNIPAEDQIAMANFYDARALPGRLMIHMVVSVTIWTLREGDVWCRT